jgi:hypothetical protein
LPTTLSDQFDVTAASLADAATRLAQLFKLAATLKADLAAAAADADAAGLGDFAEIFRAMAAKLSGPGNQECKPNSPGTKRRGRPPKITDDQAGVE